LAEPVEVIRTSALEGIPHGFLGRRGGVSTGVLAGLNVGLGTGDDAAVVAINRGRAKNAILPGAELTSVYQIHSPFCVYAARAWPEAERPQADALVTDRPGLLLGIVTADCAPVLLADPEAGVVGAAHAGWKGAFHGVIENTVQKMVEIGAARARIRAAIGPAIARRSYEVDEAFRERLGVPLDYLFSEGARAGHYQFDLPFYVQNLLLEAGVGYVEDSSLDTYSDAERFYSYRRSTHRGEPDYGRQFSLIGLPAQT